MSDINALSGAAAFSVAMQIPVYDAGNGQPRRLSGQQLVDGVQAALSSSAAGPFKLASYAVADLPSALANAAAIVYCTNGNSGQPCLAVSNGLTWLRIALSTTVSAT